MSKSSKTYPQFTKSLILIKISAIWFAIKLCCQRHLGRRGLFQQKNMWIILLVALKLSFGSTGPKFKWNHLLKPCLYSKVYLCYINTVYMLVYLSHVSVYLWGKTQPWYMCQKLIRPRSHIYSKYPKVP